MYQPCPVVQQATCYDPCGYYNNRCHRVAPAADRTTPPTPSNPSCSFVVWMSDDLVTWSVGSEALLPAMQPPSPLASSTVVYFSPFVVFNRATGMFVMWFQMYVAVAARRTLPHPPIFHPLLMYFAERAVAVSSSPLGPFP
jgi:hypothetical protein